MRAVEVVLVLAAVDVW
jgi:hypothetical protein